MKPNANLRVCYDEPSRREYERDERRAEEHLDDGNVSLLVLENLSERIAIVYPVAIVSADSKARVILIEGYEVHSVGHGGCRLESCLRQVVKYS
jgi:hypothetical protein